MRSFPNGVSRFETGDSSSDPFVRVQMFWEKEYLPIRPAHASGHELKFQPNSSRIVVLFSIAYCRDREAGNAHMISILVSCVNE